MSLVARDVSHSLKHELRLGNRTGWSRVKKKLVEIGLGLVCSHNLLIRKLDEWRMGDKWFFKTVASCEQFGREPRVVKVRITWSYKDNGPVMVGALTITQQ